MDYYKKISLRELNLKKYKETKVSDRVIYKLEEADEYRKSFEALAWSRLKLAERNEKLEKNHPLTPFKEPSPMRIFLNVLMVDFYAGLPTLAGCIVRKIGQTKATRMTKKLVEAEAIVEEKQQQDHRVKLLFPTIQTVCAYETQLAKIVVTEALKTNDADTKDEILEKSLSIKRLVNFDKLRKKYLPNDIFDLINFDLDEILEGSRYSVKINHPYLIKK